MKIRRPGGAKHPVDRARHQTDALPRGGTDDCVSDYHNHRIQVDAITVDGRYNAEVRIRRILSQDKPTVEIVTCLKLTAEHAERAGEIWAKRWVDLKASERYKDGRR